MNYNLDKKLKELKTEEFIWIIYIGIIFLSFYSNKLEKNYFLYNDTKSKEQYRNVMIIIFSILILVYYYFFKDSYEDFKNLNIYDSNKKRNLVSLSLIASTLILISGVIFLYIAYNDENIDVELAFN